jgi:tryptophan halogenase
LPGPDGGKADGERGMMPPPIQRVVVVGRDAALWLATNVIRAALAPAGVTVTAVELPSLLGPADVYATLPPLEALHNQLRIEEAALLRAVGGAFTLGQNFVDAGGVQPAFLHAYGAYGTAIDGQDFFAYWLKARRFGLPVGLEDFSLTAAAARQGRLLIPDDETEKYGRGDYGYHLPAAPYVRSLRGLAVHDNVTIHRADAIEVLGDGDRIEALAFSGQRIEGDLFIDATGGGLLIDAIGIAPESWRNYFPGDRMLVASGPKFAPIPAYAEIRAGERGWTGLYPSQAHSHIGHVYASSLCSDEEAQKDAAENSALALTDVAIRAVEPGMRAMAWAGNVVAIGAAAATFDPIHNVELHAVQLGLIRLLAFYPAGSDFSAERVEYNRLMRSSFARIRDFQAAHYRLNSYADSTFWAQARQGEISPELAHTIALFQARGEIAPYEDESFSPDSWRAFFIGHGLVPDSYLPPIDRTPPEAMKAQFRTMLGFVKEQVLRQPTHDAYLQSIARRGNG